jgi:Putative collagen-binding domain of a collagenase
MWVQSKYALAFFAANNIPFQDMVNANSIVTNSNWCLAERLVGRVIIVYLRRGGTASINLSGLGSFSNSSSTMSVQWFDPRNGGPLQTGSVTSVRYGNTAEPLGKAPNNAQTDWVVLLKCSSGC